LFFHFPGPSRRDFFATSLDRETAAKDDSLAWDDGGEYARAAEDAGVDVGGMLEAGVDAKRLLDFVSNFRRREGEMFRSHEHKIFLLPQ